MQIRPSRRFAFQTVPGREKGRTVVSGSDSILEQHVAFPRKPAKERVSELKGENGRPRRKKLKAARFKDICRQQYFHREKGCHERISSVSAVQTSRRRRVTSHPPEDQSTKVLDSGNDSTQSMSGFLLEYTYMECTVRSKWE